MLVGKAIRSYEADIVNHIQNLIRIRSVKTESRPGKPFGEGIERALSYMLALGEEMGFHAVNVDGYAGHVEYGNGEELVAVLVHLDTVPEGSGWTFEPLGGQIHDGRIYGRGASDDKGAAVVALYALKALKDQGILPEKRVRILFGTNEENGMTDMDYYFTRQPLPDYAFTPDAAYPIIYAEKAYYVLRLTRSTQPEQESPFGLRLEGGTAPNVVPEFCYATLTGADEHGMWKERIAALADAHPQISIQAWDNGELKLVATGKSGHGSYPPSGINAIAHMLQYLHELGDAAQEDAWLSFIRTAIGFEAFGESLGIACSDPVHGRLTVNMAQIQLDPHTAEVILNMRVPVTADEEAVMEALRTRCRAAGVEVEVVDYLAPLYIAPDHPLIAKLSRAYEAVTGEKAELLSIGGGTYARKLQNKGVAFGPGFRGTDTRAHQPDEFVSIEDMMKHGEICTQAIFELIRADTDAS